MTIGRLIEDRDAAITTCEASRSVGDAVSLLAERRIGALPVVDGGEVVGIFSERDVIYRIAEGGPGILEQAVQEVMTSPPVTVGPEASALAALSLMTRRRVRHLPVMAAGQMIAFISIGDLVKYRIDMIESEAEAMRNYIQTA
ncbi:MAG: CBS domain-containing protein [Novosphingobium sp.]|nr:CBS domain-containing protein [Novosphingobium sp.]